ncbi:unnamed protein product [Nesidiocoris tenuis]|uniref:Uncharacterized protein n=1 Tax=Nesidiocoris tenuis TaxID=355587 RepID=A0A6H5H5F6_9HEMI|nr:unnamed protein product [Nesidiocoris tenuis]
MFIRSSGQISRADLVTQTALFVINWPKTQQSTLSTVLWNNLRKTITASFSHPKQHHSGGKNGFCFSCMFFISMGRYLQRERLHSDPNTRNGVRRRDRTDSRGSSSDSQGRDEARGRLRRSGSSSSYAQSAFRKRRHRLDTSGERLLDEEGEVDLEACSTPRRDDQIIERVEGEVSKMTLCLNHII